MNPDQIARVTICALARCQSVLLGPPAVDHNVFVRSKGYEEQFCFVAECLEFIIDTSADLVRQVINRKNAPSSTK